MAVEQCENCRFWKENSTSNYEGHCQRYPRVVVVWPMTDQDGPSIDSAYPQVCADEWCGEWQAVKANVTDSNKQSLNSASASPAPRSC